MSQESGLPSDLAVKNPSADAGDAGSLDPWVGKIPRRRKWPPIPVFLSGEVYEQRSLAGYSPWICKKPDTTERQTHTHTHTHITSAAATVKITLPELGHNL